MTNGKIEPGDKFGEWTVIDNDRESFPEQTADPAVPGGRHQWLSVFVQYIDHLVIILSLF